MNPIMTSIPLKILLLGMLAVFSCKTAEKSSLVLYNKENNINIVVRSSCKISSIAPNEPGLKDQITKESQEAFAKLKLKGSSSLEKSNYRISKTELVITERCGVAATNGKPFVGLQQILLLENIASKQLIEFKSDTVLVDQQSLGQPSTLVPKKITLEPYITGLTDKNYLQVKTYFKVH